MKFGNEFVSLKRPESALEIIETVLRENSNTQIYVSKEITEKMDLEKYEKFCTPVFMQTSKDYDQLIFFRTEDMEYKNYSNNFEQLFIIEVETM